MSGSKKRVERKEKKCHFLFEDGSECPWQGKRLDMHIDLKQKLADDIEKRRSLMMEGEMPEVDTNAAPAITEIIFPIKEEKEDTVTLPQNVVETEVTHAQADSPVSSILPKNKNRTRRIVESEQDEASPPKIEKNSDEITPGQLFPKKPTCLFKMVSCSIYYILFSFMPYHAFCLFQENFLDVEAVETRVQARIMYNWENEKTGGSDKTK